VKHRFLHALLAAGVAASMGLAAADGQYLVYVGTYTNWEALEPPHRTPPGARSEGIYVFRFDSASGKLEPLGLAAAAENPTFLNFSPDGRFLYAANELYRFDDQASGAVSAFSVDRASGKLAFLNQVAARGTGTCYVRTDQTGKFLLLANYGSGSVAVAPVKPGGSLGAVASFVQQSGSGPSPRQAGPHAHSFNPTPDNRYAVAADLGADKLFVYRFDAATGSLAAANPPSLALKAGAGPRHLSFHPNGRFAYALNEIGSTVTVLAYNPARGAFRELQTVSTLPAGFQGNNTAAEVLVHPSGKFLYASNRGHNSIAVFAIDGKGLLQPLAYVSSQGRTPRGYSLDSEGRWLIAANKDTHNIAVFRIDPSTGIPAATGQSLEVRSPVCVRFLR
jgi:6-phosphogluconolactonase